MMSNKKPLRAEFDPGQQISQVVLVGLGGTGSQLARSVARTIYDLKRRDKHVPELVFVDPDVIEPQNVGRQMFTAADVGCYKAETLARRFNFALGLGIRWFNEPLDVEKHIARHSALICGCVDNHLARRELARASGIWVDAGNGFHNGQVVIGNCSSLEEMKDAIEFGQENGKYRYLPTAALLFPDLLEPEASLTDVEMHPPGGSCAELVEAGTQHLLVNDLMGIIAAHYCYKLLARQPIHSFMAFVDGDSLTMRSLEISRSSLMGYLSPRSA
jgi:PRTRC genetic system ThiF family protein